MKFEDVAKKQIGKFHQLVSENKKTKALNYIDGLLKKQIRGKETRIEKAGLLTAKGEYYFASTNYSLALDCYLKARDLCDDEGGKIYIEANIAGVYIGIRDIDNATMVLTRLRRQYTMRPELLCSDRMFNHYVFILICLVYCCLWQKRNAEARELLNNHLRPNIKRFNMQSMMDYYHALGEYHLRRKEYTTAEEHFLESMRFAEKDKFAVLSGYIHLAEIQIELKNPEKALAILLKHINRGNEKYISLYVEMCLLANRIYSYLKNTSRAENYMKKARKYLKQSDPLWTYTTNKEHEKLFEGYYADKSGAGRNIFQMGKKKSPLFKKVEIIGGNEELLKCLAATSEVARTDLSVLIQGETGTGKELFARLIHYLSSRAVNQFMPVNCASLTESLLETELFGYKKGAFTGAFADRKGIFEFAEGGTIFLDECSEMSQTMQKNLLRVIEEQQIRRVGDNVLKNINVRLVFGTNRDLKELVSKGVFRDDLFYRVNVFAVNLPPLRQRKNDIPELSYFFMKLFKGRDAVIKISPKAMDTLCEYSWPGNVRELENEIKRIVSVNPEAKVVEYRMLSKRILDFAYKDTAESLTEPGEKLTLSEFEKKFILNVLRKCDGNVAKTAKILDVSRVGLIKKMKRMGISVAKDIKLT